MQSENEKLVDMQRIRFEQEKVMEQAMLNQAMSLQISSSIIMSGVVIACIIMQEFRQMVSLKMYYIGMLSIILPLIGAIITAFYVRRNAGFTTEGYNFEDVISHIHTRNILYQKVLLASEICLYAGLGIMIGWMIFCIVKA